MATATATVAAYNEPFGLDETAKRFYLHGTIAISASPATYATGGLVANWSAIKDAAGALVQLGTKNVNPDTVWIQSIGGSGYVYQYNKATGKIQIFTVDAAAVATQYPLIELANAAAIPAGISGDSIEFEAEWVRG